MQFALARETPMGQEYEQIITSNAICSCQRSSDSVSILLINVTMSAIVGHFNIHDQDKFHAQLS